MFSKLGKGLYLYKIDMEPFTGDPLEFVYFMSIFHEFIERKIDYPRH